MIKLDASPSRTVVIVCDECPHWSALRFGMDEAHTCAVNHEKDHHTDSKQAREAARKWRRARREKLATVDA